MGMDTTPAWLDRSLYPFAPKRLALPDGQLSYLDEGSGPPILFAHGTPTWSVDWRHLVSTLSRNHRCIAPDHLGFGLSDRPASADYGVPAHARRLESFADALGLERFTLVAHDFGGPIALPLALAGRVERLVLLNTFFWPVDDDPHVARPARLLGGALGRFLYRVLNFSLRVITPMAYADRRALTAALHRQLLAPFAQRRKDRVLVLHALARALLGARDHYARLWEERERLAKIPSLLVWGMRDPAFTPAALARARTALPSARVVEVAAGHWPQEEAPAAVADAVGAFVDEK
jgi:haloalkane dehalogenase